MTIQNRYVPGLLNFVTNNSLGAKRMDRLGYVIDSEVQKNIKRMGSLAGRKHKSMCCEQHNVST